MVWQTRLEEERFPSVASLCIMSRCQISARRRFQEELLAAFQDLKRSTNKLEMHFLQGHQVTGQGIIVSHRKRVVLY